MRMTLEDLESLPADRFEVLVAGLLEARGFRNVLSLGGAGDEGVDLRAEWIEELPTGDTRVTLWAVQCKRYRSSVSPGEIQAVLNSALEPPHDLLLRRPDFFLIATSSRLTPNAHRVFTRANRQPEKYGCHFVLWEGEYIVDALTKLPALAEKFFAPQPARRARELPLTRLQVICDESPDEVLLTFMCERGGRVSNTTLGRTRLSRESFDELVRDSRSLAVQAWNWDASLEGRLEGVGRRLFAVIPPAVREALSRGGEYVRLTSNVHVLPFELAYDPARDALLGSVHRIGRMHFSDSAPLGVPRNSPPSILLVVPTYEGPIALPAAEREMVSLGDALNTLIPVAALSGANATQSAAARSLAEGSHQILHFAGHGVTGPGDELALAFSDGIITATDLLRHGRDARLVFLNACASGAALDRLGRELTQPLGAVLVGFVGPVTDRAAAIIAREMYRAIVDGAPVGDALHAARSRQRDELPGDYSWASLVLFGDPRFRVIQ